MTAGGGSGMSEQLQPGDVVRLKSGSPRMTVISTVRERVDLVFFNEGAHQFEYPALLMKCLAVIKRPTRDQ